MSKQAVRLARRQAFALAAVLALVLGMLMIAPSASAQEADQEAFSVTNSEFRWGLNVETGSRSHDPSAVNMMSAGIVDLPEKKRISQSDWTAKSGNITLEKRSADGKLSPATWDGVRSDRSGGTLGPAEGSYSGIEMVFRGGAGKVDPSKGTATIAWKGSVTVLYYQGDSVFTISDPELSVTNTSAKLTATLGGYKSSQTQASLWEKISPVKDIVIANLDRDKIALDDEAGFSFAPEYSKVRYPSSDRAGSFPVPFVDFLSEVGIGPFFYATGGIADPKKLPLPVAVSWDSENPTDVSDSGDSDSSKGVLGRVIDDTVEDILRAAGTDAADTAAAWMDEAWKPLQPDAVKAAQADAAAADGAAAPDDGTVVSEVDSDFEGYYEEYFSAGAPITAGTVPRRSARSRPHHRRRQRHRLPLR